MMHVQQSHAHSDPQLLEIAVLTVLYKNKTRLSLLAGEAGTATFEAMAHEITSKALALQHITNAALHELDKQLHPPEAPHGDATR